MPEGRAQAWWLRGAFVGTRKRAPCPGWGEVWEPEHEASRLSRDTPGYPIVGEALRRASE